MRIAVIGISHKLAPIEIREVVSFTQNKIVQTSTMLLDEGVNEVAIVSTCNRSEIYITAKCLTKHIDIVKKFYTNYAKQPLSEYMYIKTDDEAVEHLFCVSAGLESAIIGEDQILGQVKDALELAMSIGASKKILNRFFTQAVTSAKEIKTTTKISQTPLSMSYIAIQFLKQQTTLKNKVLMLIGVGKINRLALNYILEEQPQKIYLANRDINKSYELQGNHANVEVIDYDERYSYLLQCDIAISATAAPHVIIKAEECAHITNELILMDMALPRDIDPKCADKPNITLHDIDILKSLKDSNHAKRIELAKTATEMAIASAKEFTNWLEMTDLDNTIKHLNTICTDAKDNALSYLFKKVDLNGRDRALVEEVMASALKKIVREPIVNLKSVKTKEERDSYIQAMAYLFNIHEVEV